MKVKHWLLAACLCAVLAFTGAEAIAGRHHQPVPTQTVVLNVCHPCTGCHHDVPVCIPACVLGAPCVRFERTLIGCGRTVFEWPCGHRVIVRYQKDGGLRVVQRD